ncbi:MAG: NADH:flavin oxidoreductase/NADH oxidase family protein [Gammaproteobacteria bacterium]|nr:NADH:flavin oxidoreductase/NADH oxidase family protein [Gammaproteobacteria bacterium]
MKHRIAKAAMTEGIADTLNRANDRHVRLYRRWAEGGTRLLITGNVMVDWRYLERPGNVVIDGPQSDEQLARLRAWSSAAREAGADVWMQLSHAGRQSPKIVSREPVAPSAVPMGIPGDIFAAPRALHAEEIEDVITRFIHAAKVAKQTGFTGVQIHAAHGYLLSEFLSPRVNQRTDEWGGSLQNRARLLMRTIEGVRAAVGGSFPVSVKLNSSDFQKGGFAPDEAIRVAAWLEQAGVDLLEISGGSYEQPVMADMDGIEARYEETKRQSTRDREAYFLSYAQEIRAATTLPLMVTGGFRSRRAMVDAIDTRACDVCGMARPLCVDPGAPAKLMNGDLDSVPSWEKRLLLEPGSPDPDTPIEHINAINLLGVAAFFYQNIFRLADGKEPAEKVDLSSTYLKHQSDEARLARSLQRPRIQGLSHF